VRRAREKRAFQCVLKFYMATKFEVLRFNEWIGWGLRDFGF